MDAHMKRDGKTIEDIGHYDPMVQDKSQRVELDLERLDYWLGVGAQPTEKVAVLIKKLKKNDWGTVKAPPALQAPKQPEPAAAAVEAPAEAEEAASSEE